MGKRKKRIIFLTAYIIAMAVTVSPAALRENATSGLALACLKSGLPAATFSPDEDSAAGDTTARGSDREKKSATRQSKPTALKKSKRAKGKPLVLIYHTHATESYLPSTAGNYHTVKEENTVRQVAQVLKKSLEEEGIGVVHDKSIHDNPSYDGSYERSHVSAENILKKYPSIVCVIDLHRDAIGGNYLGDTVTVKGKKCATYSYVIGDAAPNAEQNTAFVQKLNQVAAEKYEGFTGEVMGRDYIYNQELSDKCLLLEIGNNRNHIKDVENSAEILGKIIADSV